MNILIQHGLDTNASNSASNYEVFWGKTQWSSLLNTENGKNITVQINMGIVK